MARPGLAPGTRAGSKQNQSCSRISIAKYAAIMKISPLAAFVIAAGLAFVAPGTVYSQAEDKPPQGAKDASCRYAGNTPSFCKLKIVSSAPAKILLWVPEGRQSAMTFTYSGPCLARGCVLTGDDFGYGDPAKYEVVEFSSAIVKWKELSGNKAMQEIRILAP